MIPANSVCVQPRDSKLVSQKLPRREDFGGYSASHDALPVSVIVFDRFHENPFIWIRTSHLYY